MKKFYVQKDTLFDAVLVYMLYFSYYWSGDPEDITEANIVESLSYALLNKFYAFWVKYPFFYHVSLWD